MAASVASSRKSLVSNTPAFMIFAPSRVASVTAPQMTAPPGLPEPWDASRWSMSGRGRARVDSDPGANSRLPIMPATATPSTVATACHGVPPSTVTDPSASAVMAELSERAIPFVSQ